MMETPTFLKIHKSITKSIQDEIYISQLYQIGLAGLDFTRIMGCRESRLLQDYIS